MRSLIRIGLGTAVAAAGCAPLPVHLTAAPIKAPAGGVFSPDHLGVRPGARTRFVNRDSVPQPSPASAAPPRTRARYRVG